MTKVNSSDVEELCHQVYLATRSKPKKSLVLARKALQLARQRSNLAEQGLAMRSLGHALRALARYRKALSAYQGSDRAFIEAGLLIEQARNAIGKLDAMMYLGLYEAAQKEAAQAEFVFIRENELKRLATLRVNLGSLFVRMEKHEKAVFAYEKSLEFFQREGAQEIVANIQLNLAVAYSSLLEFKKARQLFEQAGNYFRQTQLTMSEAIADYNLACLEHLRGAFGKALPALKRSLELLADRGDQSLLASCQLEQAWIFLSLSMPHSSAHWGHRAAQSFQRLDMRYEHGLALCCAGVSLALDGQTGQASQTLLKALTLFREEKNDYWVQICRLHIAQIHQEEGRPESARLLAEQARMSLTNETQESLTEQRNTRGIALAEMLLGSLPGSESSTLLNAAITRFRKSESFAMEAEALARHARILESSAPLRETEVALFDALKAAESIRAGLTMGNLRRHFHSRHGDLYCRMALNQAQRHEECGVGFPWLERGRAQSLLEKLEIESPLESEKANLSSKREDLNQLYRQFDSLQWNQQEPTDSRLRERIENLEHELALQETTARKQSPDVLYHWEITSPLDAAWLAPSKARGVTEKLQTLLPQDMLVLYYFELDDQLGLISLSQSSCKLHSPLLSCETVRQFLAWMDLEQQTERSREQNNVSERARIQSFNSQLEKMGRHLLPPDFKAENQTLLILPAGPLSYLSFPSLRFQNQPWALRWQMSHALSLQTHLRLSQSRKSLEHKSRSSLLIGYGPDLPQVGQELKSLQKILPQPTTMLPNGTIADFQENAPHARLLHVASHGIFRRDHPLFSSLQLSDGRLSFYDLFHLRLTADLVVLSSCETARDGKFSGEELMGLAGGFLQAGARAVLLSLWEVLDTSSPHFMMLFYQALLQGEKLRSAYSQAMRTFQDQKPHPIHWAPYVLLGDADQQLFDRHGNWKT